jgi:hypothetical protein
MSLEGLKMSYLALPGCQIELNSANSRNIKNKSIFLIKSFFVGFSCVKFNERSLHIDAYLVYLPKGETFLCWVSVLASNFIVASKK